MILVFDSYAWIEYFSGTDKGANVKKLMISADIIYTPTVVLLEIANKYFREGFDAKTIRERLKIVRRLSLVTPISDEVLLLLGEAQEILNKNVRKLGLKRKPSMIDYYILAFANYLKAKVVTGDEHFKGIANVIFIG